MTATRVPVEERQRPPWWDLIGHWRFVHDTLANPDALNNTLPNGKTIKWAFIQSLIWVIIGGSVLGVCAVAGGYYALFEQDWYVHIGPVHFTIFYLKHWWDGGMGIFDHLKTWFLYRHNERDMSEATTGGLFIHTLVAGRKYWNVRLRLWQLIVFPPLLMVALFGLIFGGTWLEYFGGPAAWAHVTSALHHPGYNWDGYFSWAGTLSLENIILGLLVAFIVKRAWAPIGATFQGFILDRSVGRSVAHENRVPLWIYLPVVPALRLRWSAMWRAGTVAAVEGEKPWVTHVKHFLLTVITVLTVLLIILGALARWPIAHGVHIPYLNP